MHKKTLPHRIFANANHGVFAFLCAISYELIMGTACTSPQLINDVQTALSYKFAALLARNINVILRNSPMIWDGSIFMDSNYLQELHSLVNHACRRTHPVLFSLSKSIIFQGMLQTT